MTTRRTGEKMRFLVKGPTPLKAIGVLSFLALSGLFLLAACGGDEGESTPSAQQTPTPAATPSTRQTQAPAETPKPAAGAIDPCALVTKAEVEAALGASVTEPEQPDIAYLVADNVFICSYKDPETPIFDVVTVRVLTLEDKDQARDAFEMGREGSETVTGIGEDAYWTAAPFNSLEVLKGKYDVRIDVSPTDGKDELAIAKDLAAKVVGRLP